MASLILIGVLAIIATKRRGIDYTLCSAQPTQPAADVGCTEECQGLAVSSTAWEASQHASSLGPDSFYSVPKNFSSSLVPGTLLRTESVTDTSNYTIPSGLTLSRIIYTTTFLNDTTVPASAYILWPYVSEASVDHKPLPLVAWAHGTSGLFPSCAPSNYRALQYHFMVPFELALSGYVVVAPDYAGLGIDAPSITGRHPWLYSPASANDLAYAVVAARKAFTSLLQPEGPFVTMGHSQGGSVAFSFAERQHNSSLAVSGYKGTIAIAPQPGFIQSQLPKAYEALANKSAAPEDLAWVVSTLSTQPLLIAGITHAYPRYNYAGMTPAARDIWLNAVQPQQACLASTTLLYGSQLNFTSLAKRDWFRDPTVQEWADKITIGQKPTAGPVLVILGEQDVIVPHAASGVDDIVERQCANGAEIEYDLYDHMNHFSVILASKRKWIDWIGERIGSEAGKGTKITEKCKTVRHAGPLGPRVAPFPPNEGALPLGILEFEGGMDAWKLAF